VLSPAYIKTRILRLYCYMHVVTKGQKALYQESVETKKILATFHQRQPLKWTQALVFDWLVIIGLVAVTIAFDSILINIFACLFIAGRQHALMVLMHEGAHGNIIKSKRWNLLISDLFCAWPTFISTEAYAQNHIEHHRLTNRTDDPDMKRKLGKKEWLFPKTWSALFSEAIEFALFVGPKEQYKMARHVGVLNMREWWSKAVLLIYLILIALTGHLFHAMILWFSAYFFILPTLFRIRSLGEHFGLPERNYLNSTRNTYASAIEKALISPHKINLHLTHHLYPGAPFYNLDKIDCLLFQVQPEYVAEGSFSNTYLSTNESSVIRQLTTPTLASATQV